MTRGFRIPWLGLSLLVALPLSWGGAWVLRTLPVALPACPMKTHLGIPCATCGITRCLLAMSEGRWAEAFHWHPVVALLILAAPMVAIWDFQRAWRGRPYPSLPDSLAARLCAAALLAATWALQIVRGV